MPSEGLFLVINETLWLLLHPSFSACTPFTLCFHLLLWDILENEAAVCISLADRRIIKLINRGWMELSVKGVGRSSLLYYRWCITTYALSLNPRVTECHLVMVSVRKQDHMYQQTSYLRGRHWDDLWWNCSFSTKLSVFPIILHIICIHAFNRLLSAW